MRPNNTIEFARPRSTGVQVHRGPTLDGLGKYLTGQIEESGAAPVDVATTLRETGTDVLVCYLPVGSQAAAEFYAEQALQAGCAMVNCIPVFIASDKRWARRFEERRVPIVGDDIKSQVGATIVHRMLTNLFRERGVRVDRIAAVARKLSSHPEAGRSRPELATGLRSFPIGNYVLFYKADPTHLVLVRVLSRYLDIDEDEFPA